MFANVSLDLAAAFAEAIDATPPKGLGSNVEKSSPALSQLNTVKKPNTRKVGVIVGQNVDGEAAVVLNALKEEGIQAELISDKLGKRESIRWY